jgi:hypothetical protein
MNRAFVALEFKAMQEEDGKRRFTGIATTPTPDRVGDIVEPKGAQFKLPIPLLWQHMSSQPIGWVTEAKVTDKGIEVAGEVALISEEGTLKARLDEAWQSMKAKLVAGLSIGFITAIKSADEAIRRAAFGVRSVVRLDPAPAASGESTPGDSGSQARRKGVVYL